MPFFHYLAKNKKGENLEGKINASSYSSALSILQKQKIYIISLKKQREFATLERIKNLFNKVPLKEKMVFTNELSIMIKSGMPLLASIKTLATKGAGENLEKILNAVATDIEAGFSLSTALGKHPNVFDKTYIKTVQSGEKSGKLDEVLLRLSKNLEKDYDTFAKIKGAFTYPIFILAIMIIVLIIMFIYVIPQLSSIFEEAGAKLPLVTRIIIGTSDSFLKFWWAILAIVIVLGFLFNRYINTPKGGFVFDQLKIKIPIFGKLLKNIYLMRFARTLSSLLSAGVPMLEVLETTKDVIGNRVYQKDLKAIIKKVSMGESLTSALKETRNFPSMIIELIAVGERSGKIDYVLKNLAHFLEKEVDNTTKNLTSLLEPILMVIMGVGVAIIVASVIMPIYGLVQVIGGG